MFRLHVVPRRGEPFDCVFDGDSLVVGRSQVCDLGIGDPLLSRRHARLFRSGDSVLLEDLGSHNGTMLNGQWVREPVPVQGGDVILVSGSSIYVHALEEGSAIDGASEGVGGVMPGAAAEAATESLFRAATELLDSYAPAQFGDRPEVQLRRYAERLKLLNDIHQALGRSIALDELLELMLDRAFEHLQPDEGAIFLRESDGSLRRAATRTRSCEPGTLYSLSLIREVTEKKLGALVADVGLDQRFAEAESVLGHGVRSLVAAPLLDGEHCLGMIVLDSRSGLRRFSEEDLELLVSLASVAALRIRNISLAEEAAERDRLEAELALARRIQESLLSDRSLEVPGFAVHGRNAPSRGVSGDTFSVIERCEGRDWLLMVSDVSGKGIAASMLAAYLQALCAPLIAQGLPPEEICGRASPLLHASTPPEQFATAFIAALEPSTGAVRYANAGHNPPLVVRASGQVETLQPTGMPLGLLEGSTYDGAAIRLEPGEVLVIYSDGITETCDTSKEEFGLDRLIDFCLRNPSQDPIDLADALEAELERFAEGAPPADDRTLLIARRHQSG